MKTRLLSCATLALPVVTLLAACATGGTFADIASERDHLLKLDTTLATIGKFPSPEVIAPDAQLVTFPYSVPADTTTWVRRDTLVGPDGISSWLEQWHGRQLPAVDFVLTPMDVQGCDGVAVQEGVYPVKGTDREAQAEDQPYRAVWIQRSDGTWMLHRLWLKPDSRAHLTGPVTGCHTLGSTSRDMHRMVVEAEVLYGGKQVANQVADAMRAAGWTYTLPLTGTFPRTEGVGIGFAASFRYRLTPAWGIQGLLIQNPIDRARGRLTTAPREPRFQETDRWLGLLGAFSFGPARIAAGPALALVNFDWSELYSSMSGIAPVSVSRTRFGGVAQLAVNAPLALSLQPVLVARYTFAAKAQVPAFMGLAPFDVSMGRFTIGLGLGYSF
jgi:hypothetical protein